MVWPVIGVLVVLGASVAFPVVFTWKHRKAQAEWSVKADNAVDAMYELGVQHGIELCDGWGPSTAWGHLTLLSADNEVRRAFRNAMSAEPERSSVAA